MPVPECSDFYETRDLERQIEVAILRWARISTVLFDGHANNCLVAELHKPKNVKDQPVRWSRLKWFAALGESWLASLHKGDTSVHKRVEGEPAGKISDKGCDKGRR